MSLSLDLPGSWLLQTRIDGMTLARAMKVTGNILVIELETTAADAIPVVRTLAWHRLNSVT